MEIGDLGQLATWDFKKELYNRNETVYKFVLDLLNREAGREMGPPTYS